MSRRLLFAAALFGAGFSFVAGEAAATTLTTNTLSIWETSGYITGSATELSFGPIQLQPYNTSSGITLYGIQQPSVGFDFTGPDGGGYVLSGYSYHSLNSLAGASDAVGVMDIATPASGESAMFLSVASTGNTPLTLSLSDGESFSVVSGAFIGLSVSHPITWLSLSTSSGSQPILDDFYFADSSLQPDAPTAEVASFFLLGGGLLILFGARRKLLKLAA